MCVIQDTEEHVCFENVKGSSGETPHGSTTVKVHPGVSFTFIASRAINEAEPVVLSHLILFFFFFSPSLKLI